MGAVNPLQIEQIPLAEGYQIVKDPDSGKYVCINAKNGETSKYIVF